MNLVIRHLRRKDRFFSPEVGKSESPKSRKVENAAVSDFFFSFGLSDFFFLSDFSDFFFFRTFGLFGLSDFFFYISSMKTKIADLEFEPLIKAKAIEDRIKAIGLQ